jgi:hypothetical protein
MLFQCGITGFFLIELHHSAYHHNFCISTPYFCASYACFLGTGFSSIRKERQQRSACSPGVHLSSGFKKSLFHRKSIDFRAFSRFQYRSLSFLLYISYFLIVYFALCGVHDVITHSCLWGVFFPCSAISPRYPLYTIFLLLCNPAPGKSQLQQTIKMGKTSPTAVAAKMFGTSFFIVALHTASFFLFFCIFS